MKPESKFWDKIADKYAKSPIKNMDAYEQTMSRTRAYLNKESRVLEVGCGTGSTALLLAPELEHLTATDISGRMIEIAQGKATDQAIDNITFKQAPMPDPSLEAKTYDAVLTYNTLHLLTDLPGALRCVQKTLKPGGVFISKTPCLKEQTSLWAIPLVLARLLRLAPYVNLLKFADVDRAIASAGFEIVETGLYPAPLNHFVVARKISSD
ncbi:MAG: methyltransferase domain-containing protein [Alphaproteobacteria bacterium]|nr:methyltransferase domain-containing protein [Alphaproteobacteria bacterium]